MCICIHTSIDAHIITYAPARAPGAPRRASGLCYQHMDNIALTVNLNLNTCNTYICIYIYIYTYIYIYI